MITVTQQSDHAYVISSASGAPLGWTGVRTIGFGPFASEASALEAAAAAWPLLQSGLVRQYPGWERIDVAGAPLRVVHDGAYHWISDGRVPLARLYRPGSAHARQGFAIELVLPSFANDGVAIAIAPVLARAVEPLLMASRAAGPATSPSPYVVSPGDLPVPPAA